MKKLLIPAALVAAVILTASGAKKAPADPVLMTINGKDVKVSEFDYLYNKNNKQQAEPQSVADYVDLFVNYKLKVADAEAAGLDTTQNFIKEYRGYCNDLAKPYLQDSTVRDRLVEEAMNRMPRMYHAAHILLPMTPAGKHTADSLKAELNKGAEFEELARKHSTDRYSSPKGGDQGWILACDYPYDFETAVFNTPVGTVSEVVEDAPYGYHLIKVYEEKPNPGEVRASHILLMTRGLDEAQKEAKKVRIDSIYTALTTGGADFATLATELSEDPGSAKRGGDLGFFGPGKMVPEFEKVAYSLEPGQISEPFLSPFGWHIVHVTGQKGATSREAQMEVINNAISRDRRSVMPEEAKIAQLKKEYGVKVDDKAVAKINAEIADMDDAYPFLQTNQTVVGYMGKEPLTVAQVAELLGGYRKGIDFSKAVDVVTSELTKRKAMEILKETDADYRNLVNEYRDGILLFDKSQELVWNKASEDKEGLENFFKTNRSKYSWDKPHFKGAIIFANSDSVSQAAQSYLYGNKTPLDSVVAKLRDHFGRNIKVENVVMAQGENAIVDNVAFGGEKPAAPGSWVAWFGYEGRIIDQPEEAADLRGAVTTDYQQFLEDQWVKDLRAKYPVSYNKKELDKIKKRKN